MKIKETNVRVYEGDIQTPSGQIVETPALIIDRGFCGTLIAWGDQPQVEAKYRTIIESYWAVGSPTDDLVLIILDNTNMSREEQCYILRRCIEYTASGFHNRLCEMMSNTSMLDWLREEMRRVPIDVRE